MKERWGHQLTIDPFYNKNFSLDRAPFTELLPPEDAAAIDWAKLAATPLRRFDAMQPANMGPADRPSLRKVEGINRKLERPLPKRTHTKSATTQGSRVDQKLGEGERLTGTDGPPERHSASAAVPTTQPQGLRSRKSS